MRFEQRWRDQLCAAILPRDRDGGLPGIGDLDTSCTWPRLLDKAPSVFRIALRFAVWSLTLSPLLMLGRPRLLGSLRREDQERVLVRALGSRLFALRQVTAALRLAACVCYLADPGVRSLVTAERS